MLNRRQWLASSAAMPWIATLRAAEAPRHWILLSPADSARMSEAAKQASTLEKLAEAAMHAGPWTVTSRRPTGVDAAPNDYYSEGPYWWPDPSNPGGPYIRKDGETNPNRFTANRNDLGKVCETTLALGIGAHLLRKPGCVERAGKILSVWFLDAKTKMNPHLEFGQAVRGINTGRGTGIIDTVSFIHAVQGITMLEAAGLDASLSAGLRKWFADYLKWMTTSSKGLDEKESGNNHATWWTAQAAAYAAFTGDAAALRMAWDHYRNYLVPTEIRPDGSCPREEARTKSLGYSAMNLDAFAVICRIAQMSDVDLWRFKTAQGVGVETAFNYLLPYMLDPKQWTRGQQIAPFNPGGYVFLGLAGAGLGSKTLLEAWRKIPHAESAWVQLIGLAV